MAHKLRLIRSKYSGKGYLDSRLEQGDILNLSCGTKLKVSLCKRGNVKNEEDNNTCYDPYQVTTDVKETRNCCKK
jgi:hypothetical protein